MLPSQSAYLLPDTEVKHWQSSGSLDRIHPLQEYSQNQKLSLLWTEFVKFQQFWSKQRENVVSLNEVLSGWRALTHLALIKSIIRLWWRSGMWGMPVDFSHLCDNHSQTLDSLILFLMVLRQPQCLSLIYSPLPTFGSNISKHLRSIPHLYMSCRHKWRKKKRKSSFLRWHFRK